MAASGKRAGVRAAIGVLAASLLTLGVSAPASAQGIFDRIFGGLRHAVEAAAAADQHPGLCRSVHQSGQPFNPPPPLRAAKPVRPGFCVRTCDGRYFPVQAHAGLSAAEACRSFCPASQTRLYSGGNYRLRDDERRQPLCRSRQRLRLSQAIGGGLHLQRPRRVRAGAYRCNKRSDAAPGRRGRHQERADGLHRQPGTRPPTSRRSSPIARFAQERARQAVRA